MIEDVILLERAVTVVIEIHPNLHTVYNSSLLTSLETLRAV